MTDPQRTVVAALMSATESESGLNALALREDQVGAINSALYWLFIADDGISMDEADHVVQNLEDAGLRVEPKILIDLMKSFYEREDR